MKAAHHDFVVGRFIFFGNIVGSARGKGFNRKGNDVGIHNRRQRLYPLVYVDHLNVCRCDGIEDREDQRLHGIVPLALHHTHSD